MVNRIFEKSDLYDSIPIAVIDKDQSKLTEAVIESLEHNKAIRLELISERKIEGYISSERVQAVYIFEEDMESNIEKGKYEGIVSVYTVPGSITAMGISDIIAGEIVPYITRAKVANSTIKLIKNEEASKIRDSIYKRVEDIKGDLDYTLPVNVSMRTPEKALVEEDENQKGDIFSIQIGLGLIIIFLLYLCLPAAALSLRRGK
jgi:hypothetical protein